MKHDETDKDNLLKSKNRSKIRLEDKITKIEEKRALVENSVKSMVKEKKELQTKYEVYQDMVYIFISDRDDFDGTNIEILDAKEREYYDTLIQIEEKIKKEIRLFDVVKANLDRVIESYTADITEATQRYAELTNEIDEIKISMRPTSVVDRLLEDIDRLNDIDITDLPPQCMNCFSYELKGFTLSCKNRHSCIYINRILQKKSMVK